MAKKLYKIITPDLSDPWFDFLKGVKHLVRPCSLMEKRYLFREWAKKARHYNPPGPYHPDPIDWEEGMGKWLVIGHVGDLPVCITLWKDTIKGHPVVFVEDTSTVVHHDLIQEWLSLACPGVESVNPDNFHNCVRALDK